MLKIIKIYKKFYLYYEEETWTPVQPYTQDCYRICDLINISFTDYSNIVKSYNGKFYSNNGGFCWHSFSNKKDIQKAFEILESYIVMDKLLGE